MTIMKTAMTMIMKLMMIIKLTIIMIIRKDAETMTMTDNTSDAKEGRQYNAIQTTAIMIMAKIMRAITEAGDPFPSVRPSWQRPVLILLPNRFPP